MFCKWLVCSTILFLGSVYGLPNRDANEFSKNFIPCEARWHFFGEKCYRLFGGDRVVYGRLNRKTASERCEKYGGHLATIQSQVVQDFLFTFLLLESDVSAWIGLNDLQNETRYEWPDGTKVSYTNWNVGEPSEYKIEHEDCVNMLLQTHKGEPGKWNDSPCAEKLAYICQVDAGKQRRRSRDPKICSPEMGGGWRFGDSCYNILKENMAWEDAEKYCQNQYKGHLVTILNFQTDYFLNYIMANFNTDVWIGIKIKDQIQQVFSSGWPVVRTNWLKTPNVFVDGTCVVRRKGKWNVVPCANRYPFICEVSNVRPPVLENHMEGSKCPQQMKDWVDFGGDSCYFIETENIYSWYRANFECIRRGASLVSFHSREEIEAFYPYAKNALLRNSGVFIGLYREHDSEDIFEWTDGSQMDFTYWTEGEPNSEHDKCAEAFAPNMKWNDVHCEAHKGYICAVKKFSGVPDIGLNKCSENFIPCEEGWYFFGEKCYKIGNYDHATYEDAITRCAEMGGKLASIHSKEQNDFLNAFLAINMKQFPWIGLNDRDKESVFVWEDGSPVDYLNWQGGQPDNNWFGKEEENCVELINEQERRRIGKWNDLPCHHKKGYICQKESNKELKTPDPQFCSDGEGGGWKFRNSCFTLVNEKKSWEDAEDYCQNTFNGHLTMILDMEHDTFLEFVLRNTKSPLWIGLKTQDRFQQIWTTGWPVSYNHFEKPLEEIETGSCIFRQNEKSWSNVPCDEIYAFVCQRVNPPAIKKPSHMSKCPEFPNDWRDFGGEFCYFIDEKLFVHWYEGHEICRSRGGVLATIYSQEEEEVLHSFLRPLTTHVSIGLNSLLTNGKIFAWSDGSELNYTNWAPAEPSKKDEMCVLIRTNDMSWYDFYCNMNAIFLCQVKKEEVTSENPNVEGEDLEKNENFKKNPNIGDEKCKEHCAREKMLKILIGITV